MSWWISGKNGGQFRSSKTIPATQKGRLYSLKNDLKYKLHSFKIRNKNENYLVRLRLPFVLVPAEQIIQCFRCLRYKDKMIYGVIIYLFPSLKFVFSGLKFLLLCLQILHWRCRHWRSQVLWGLLNLIYLQRIKRDIDDCTAIIGLGWEGSKP